MDEYLDIRPNYRRTKEHGENGVKMFLDCCMSVDDLPRLGAEVTASSKITIARLLKTGLKPYSRTDEGMVFSCGRIRKVAAPCIQVLTSFLPFAGPVGRLDRSGCRGRVERPRWRGLPIV